MATLVLAVASAALGGEPHASGRDSVAEGSAATAQHERHNALRERWAAQVDADLDGVLDARDNCPWLENRAQLDGDRDGVGDACDGDRDGDGVLNVFDNCPSVANAQQFDDDGDGIGDSCAYDAAREMARAD